MDFIQPTPILYKKTPSLRLRLRVARLRLGSILSRLCSVVVACLFPVCSVFVAQGANAANSYPGSHG